MNPSVMVLNFQQYILSMKNLGIQKKCPNYKFTGFKLIIICFLVMAVGGALHLFLPRSLCVILPPLSNPVQTTNLYYNRLVTI